MIKRMKKITATILAGVMILLPASTTFAASKSGVNYEINIDNVENIEEELNEDETLEVLKDNFNNMSEEEKQIFLNDIKYDEDLLNFHKKNIDPSCDIEKPTRSKRSASALSQVRAGLQGLRLPTPVYYSLMSFASSLAAAVADGPLPVGDVAAIGSGVATAIAVGYYWDDIRHKTGKIKNVFTRAFGTAGRNISRGLDRLFSKAESKSKHPANDVTDKVKKEVKKKLGQRVLDKFESAVKKGIVGPSGQDGIKQLKGRKNKKYQYEIKVKTIDARIAGWGNSSGKIIFDKLTDHKGINRLP